MLVAQSIPVLLGQTLTDGVESALLLQMDGSILGSRTVLTGDQTQSNLASAIEATSLWQNFAAATSQMETQSLRCCLVECEGRKICLLEVSRLLLCIVGTGSAHLGMLRKKTQLVAQQFKGKPIPPSFSLIFFAVKYVKIKR